MRRGENRITRWNTCPSATLSTQIPHELTWDRTRASAVGGRLLTALSHGTTLCNLHFLFSLFCAFLYHCFIFPCYSFIVIVLLCLCCCFNWPLRPWLDVLIKTVDFNEINSCFYWLYHVAVYFSMHPDHSSESIVWKKKNPGRLPFTELSLSCHLI
jgi:hypothetical protein